ncbi:MAG: prolipoprotein diacylglyceryl transferase [Phycisphaerales bacterium]|nr:prolipoprotein diacylglyceryl transferase [Phycisphaerales bacterium]
MPEYLRSGADRALIDGVPSGAADQARERGPLLSARHHSQNYQALGEGVVVGAALWIVWARPRKPGVVTGCFFLVYGVGRIVTEFWRLPDAHLRVQRPGGLSYGQWLSVAMLLVGAAILWRAMKSAQQPVGGWLSRRAGASG